MSSSRGGGSWLTRRARSIKRSVVCPMADTTATYPGSEPYFDRDLAMVADVFEVWRYIHEQHPIDTDLGFMQRLARAVEKALAAMT